MSDGPAIAFYLLALILPVSALVARRMPVRRWVPMVLAWVAIFAVGWLVVTYLT